MRFLTPLTLTSLRARHASFILAIFYYLTGSTAPIRSRNGGRGRVATRPSQPASKTSVDVVSEDSNRFAGMLCYRRCGSPISVFLNEFEAQRTTGIEIVQNDRIDFDGARKAARQLLASGVRQWVAIHFPAGAIAVGSNGQEFIQPSLNMPQAQIAGTTGRRRRLRSRCASGFARKCAHGHGAQLWRLCCCFFAHRADQFRWRRASGGMSRLSRRVWISLI